MTRRSRTATHMSPSLTLADRPDLDAVSGPGLRELKRGAHVRRLDDAEAAGVAAKRAVGGDDPVARDHDRDRIGAQRRPGGTRCLLVPSLARDDLVRRELAVRNTRGRGEDPLLERCECGEVGLDVERTATAREVLIELCEDAVAAPAIGQHTGTVGVDDPRELPRVRRRAVMDIHDTARADGDPERTER